MTLKQSVVEKWKHDLNEERTFIELVVVGIPDGYYADEENLDDALGDAVAEFCRRHRYSETTENLMLDDIEVRDEFYKAMETNGYELPSSREEAMSGA